MKIPKELQQRAGRGKKQKPPLAKQFKDYVPVQWRFQWGFVKNKYGTLLVYEPKKFIPKYADLSYQHNIVKLLENGKYECFVDVGAAFGLFPLIASHYCKKIIAYEALPFRFGLLLQNMAHLPKVECRYAYVSQKEDTPKMGDPFQMVKRTDEESYNIPLVTLDEELNFLIPIKAPPEDCGCKLKLPKPMRTLIKIDVEGNELKVLNGATELLKQPHIHWTIDVHPYQNVEIKDVKKYFIGRAMEAAGNNNVTFKRFK